MYQPVLKTRVGPTVSFLCRPPAPLRSLPAEIRTKDTDNHAIIFAGPNDLVIGTSRPSLHSDFPISASTSALTVLFGSETLNGYS